MIDTEDARLLVDVGFIAATRGLAREARAVFEAVLAARPDQEAGPVGLAFVLLLEDKPEEAEAVLRAAPPTDAVQAFLALARARRGELTTARRLLGDLAATAGDPAAASLATDILDALEPSR